ncbi:hypothetical protein M413DRAFT_448904 [Hebeloma cylindrosporum]|uniref:Uncharacterized protein n=1 Tax=Hebeloma cylindrosporum TaxID=76867 RepID=A0A0C3BZ96_HEBCY|nr:hypothetical protein M413DRAFT_448904 [Hebeloma cylindrosporum h7]
MIIIDPSETTGNSPNERSPLKTGEMSATTPLAGGQAPPPPYAAEPVTAPVHSYQAAQSVPAHQQIYVQQPQTGGPFKRFLKAFLVAVLALFLWGIFLDSVDMAIGTSAGRYGKSQGMRIRWIIHEWYVGSDGTKSSSSPPVLCPCEDQVTPTTPGRVRPIQYPPIVQSSKSSPLPIQYPSALPKGEIEVSQQASFLPKAQVPASNPFQTAIRNPNST